MKELIRQGNRGDAVALFMTEAVGVPAQYVGPMRQGPMWAGLEAIAPTLIYDDALMGETMSGSPASLERWRTVKVPALVVSGGASPPHVHRGCSALSSVLGSTAKCVTLAGQSHAYEPEALAPTLSDFFAST